MPYQHTTAFGTTQGNLSDDERLRAQQGMNNNALQAQMAALNAEIADRQAGRTFQGDQAAQDRTFQGGMFDRNAGLQNSLADKSTARAMGVAGLEMGPANIDAGIRQREANVKLPIEEARGKFQLQALQNAMGGMGTGGTGAPPAGGAPAAPGGPGGAPQGGGLDPDATMFMAWGGNPGEYMQQKRQQVQADRQHQDAEDARNMDLGMRLASNPNPSARALGATILAKVKNSGLGGADPSILQSALQPQIAPAEALKSPQVGQMFDELAANAKEAGTSVNNQASLQKMQTMIPALVKAMVDKGVMPDDASAFIKGELGKLVPQENGLLRLATYFPGMSSGGQTRQALGYQR